MSPGTSSNSEYLRSIFIPQYFTILLLMITEPEKKNKTFNFVLNHILKVSLGAYVVPVNMRVNFWHHT